MEPSHVIRALGGPRELAHTACASAWAASTTSEEVEYVGARVVAAVKRLRDLSPLYRVNAKLKRANRDTINGFGIHE